MTDAVPNRALIASDTTKRKFYEGVNDFENTDYCSDNEVDYSRIGEDNAPHIAKASMQTRINGKAVGLQTASIDKCNSAGSVTVQHGASVVIAKKFRIDILALCLTLVFIIGNIAGMVARGLIRGFFSPLGRWDVAWLAITLTLSLGIVIGWTVLFIKGKHPGFSKKRAMLIVVAVLMVLVNMLVFVAYDFRSNDDRITKFNGRSYTYCVNSDGSVGIVDMELSESIIIPARIDERKVTWIHSDIKSSSQVKELVVEDPEMEIVEGVFSSWKSVENIKLPEKITAIGDQAFYNCRKLMTISGCTSLGEVELPISVATISDNAFSNCTSLRVLELPQRLEVIGARAFENCTAVPIIYIPHSVTYVGNSAFSGWTENQTIYLYPLGYYFDIEWSNNCSARII